MNVDVGNYPQKQDLPRSYMLTGGFYIRKAELLNESRGLYLGNDIRGYPLSLEEALDIDTEDDISYFKYLIEKKQNKKFMNK